MLAVLQGDFFWGVIVGLFLSFFGGWSLAWFTVYMQQKSHKDKIILFSIDTIKNIQSAVGDMEKIRDRTGTISVDYLLLIDVEIQIYGRNREHFIQLSDVHRGLVRTFMSDIALKRAAISYNLGEFYKISNATQEARVNKTDTEVVICEEKANTYFTKALEAASQISTLTKDANALIMSLSNK